MTKNIAITAGQNELQKTCARGAAFHANLATAIAYIAEAKQKRTTNLQKLNPN